MTAIVTDSGIGIDSSMLIVGEHVSTPNLISIAIITIGLAVGLYRRSAGSISADPKTGLP